MTPARSRGSAIVAVRSSRERHVSARTSLAFLLVLAALMLFAGCSSTAERPPARLKRPRPATLRNVQVHYVRVMHAGGITIVEPISIPDSIDTRPENLGVVLWPAEAFEGNVIEERRERDQLRAAPFWEP